MKKLKLALCFGGQSPEHDISIQSARSVFQNLDPHKYDVFLIGIDQRGTWLHITDTAAFLKPTSKLNDIAIGQPVTLTCKQGLPEIIYVKNGQTLSAIDVAFPLLHGPYGEDGSFQGLLKCHNLRFVGSDVLSSAICMDKAMTKKLLLSAGLPTARYVEASLLESSPFHYKKPEIYEKMCQLTFPVFVKPANMGSSIGVSKVIEEKLLMPAIKKAFEYDKKILVEEAIKGREIEVAVLGGQQTKEFRSTNTKSKKEELSLDSLAPLSSSPGEIIPRHDFYSYKAKYLDDQGAILKTSNLDLSTQQIKDVQHLARQVFLLLECEGMARVDFFLKANGQWVINEVNTLPGFTAISMYPQLWQVSGLTYPQLLDQLINLAVEKPIEHL